MEIRWHQISRAEKLGRQEEDLQNPGRLLERQCVLAGRLEKHVVLNSWNKRERITRQFSENHGTGFGSVFHHARGSTLRNCEPAFITEDRALAAREIDFGGNPVTWLGTL